jgi:hypothetical protein
VSSASGHDQEGKMEGRAPSRPPRTMMEGRAPCRPARTDLRVVRRMEGRPPCRPKADRTEPVPPFASGPDRAGPSVSPADRTEPVPPFRQRTGQSRSLRFAADRTEPVPPLRRRTGQSRSLHYAGGPDRAGPSITPADRSEPVPPLRRRTGQGRSLHSYPDGLSIYQKKAPPGTSGRRLLRKSICRENPLRNYLSAACAADNRATGTRGGEQLT